MENIIKYFYNIYPKEIKEKDSGYYFKDEYNEYIFYKTEKDIVYINYIYSYFIKNNLYCHKIIINKDNSLFTLVENNKYLLLKIEIDNKKINYEDIINFNYLIEADTCNWDDLWIKKIDYYEYQIGENKKRYPKLYEIFDYYAGLLENAISLVSSIKKVNINLYVCHDRINKEEDIISFYNPINFVVDSKVRDIASYFKNSFFNNKEIRLEVLNYLNQSNLTYEEAMLFLARMLYPSYFFDIYDEIIKGNKEEDEINSVIIKIDKYQQFLKELYYLLKARYNMIDEIDWLIKT